MVSGCETGREGSSQDGGENTSRGNGLFTANGKDHYVHPLWKVLTAVLALPLGGAFVGGIVSYRTGLSAVDERISNHRELNRKLDKYEWEIQNINRTLDKHENQITNIEQYFKPKGKM